VQAFDATDALTDGIRNVSPLLLMLAAGVAWLIWNGGE